MIESIRVAVIGAGPSGLLFLHRLEQLKRDNDNDFPEMNVDVKCFEKSDSFGGMWKYDESTGDKCHASMYEQMWTNSPKETIEVPSYTFEDHFKGKKMGSMLPRVVMLDYLGGLVAHSNLEKYIQYNHHVEHVKFDATTNKFDIQVKDDIGNIDESVLDFVIVGSGHFSTPNYVPEVMKKLDEFSGRIEHSHNYRRASDFTGDRVLLIGNSYSGEDLGLQLMKFKAAQHVTICYHHNATGYHWPDGITEKPVLQSCYGKCVTFEDGSVEEYDTVIMATGYHHAYNFLDDELRLKSPNLYYTPLYQGTVFPTYPQLFYIGSQNLVYSFTMFELQAAFAWEVIMNRFTLPNKEEMEESIAKYTENEKVLKSVKEVIDFQTSYLKDMMDILGHRYAHDVTCA